MEAFGGLAEIGVLFGGIGFAYSQFKSGSVKAKDELIATLKDTALAEREKASQLAKDKIEQQNFHQTQINQLNEKIGKLQGLYEESKDRNKEYLAILQGRNPEQQKFMEYLTQVASESAKYMKESSEILRKINNHIETEHADKTIEETKKTVIKNG